MPVRTESFNKRDIMERVQKKIGKQRTNIINRMKHIKTMVELYPKSRKVHINDNVFRLSEIKKVDYEDTGLNKSRT
eukprot:UN01610